MAVDEFGREIPGRGAATNTGSGNSNTSFLDSPLPSGRGNNSGDRRHHQQERHDRGGGDSFYPSDQHPSEYSRSRHQQERQQQQQQQQHRPEGGGDPTHRSIAPHQQSSSLSFHPQQHQAAHAPTHHYHALPSTTKKQQQQQQHPSFHYVEEPLLCQFLWKEEQKIAKQLQQELLQQQQQESNEDGDNNNTAATVNEQPEEKMNDPQQQQGDSYESETTALGVDAIVDKSIADTNNNMNDENNNDDDAAAAAAAESLTAVLYEDYKQSYCLNYIRAFFNAHLDDSWFRVRYSPRVRLQAHQAVASSRTHGEARALAEALHPNAAANSNNAARDAFLATIRLGGGVKKSSHHSSTAATIPPLPSGHLFSFQQYPLLLSSGGGDIAAGSSTPTAALHLTELAPYVTDAQLLAALAAHSAEAAVFKKATVRKAAAGGGGNSSNNSLSDLFALIPTSTMTTMGRNALQREAIVIASASIVREILSSLANEKQQQQRNNNANRKNGGGANDGYLQQHLPRKGDAVLPRKNNNNESDLLVSSSWYSLEVECSDPYGRLEYDADGRGAATPDGLAVPIRKSIVTVSSLAPHQHLQNCGSTSTPVQQQSPSSTRNAPHYMYNAPNHNAASPSKCVTVTLSAALSSSERWADDAAAAARIAAALDMQQDVPLGCRLQDLLPSASDNDDNVNAGGWSITDRLDLSIAYLRRVHCLSFYHGCVQSESVADVVTGKSPVSTIHLRLQNADEILLLKQSPNATSNDDTSKAMGQQINDDNGTDKLEPADAMVDEATNKDEVNSENKGPKDLLVQRLDNAIAKVILESESGIDSYRNNLSQMELEAREIQEAECEVQDRWLADHAITDADGRARCSFAFCHKLFKDSNFLCQHLLKKHAEYLEAEQAKCHDAAMMKSWDEGTLARPVPDILVDCGIRFGTVATPVLGGPIPNCVDPEPELWRREEERRDRETEMQKRREEARNQNQQQRQLYEQQSAPPQRPRPAPTFIDVDDMKEEKVELSFDAVQVPDPSATTKKKKKRKLL